MEAITTLFVFLLIVFLQGVVSAAVAFGTVFLYYKRKYRRWADFPKAKYYTQSMIAFLVLFALYFLYRAAQS